MIVFLHNYSEKSINYGNMEKKNITSCVKLSSIEKDQLENEQTDI